MTIDIKTLPPPAVLETLEYEAALAQAKAMLIELHPEISEVINLESDPAAKILQTIVYIEITLRAHVNDALKSNLIALATGSDLDHRAAFYGIARLPEETDDRFRLRVQLRIAALAGNGTAEQYRATALGASIDVVDAGIMQSPPGQIAVAVWAKAGSEPETVLPAVHAALTAEPAKILGVPVTVHLARPRVIDIVGTLYRETSAPLSIVTDLALALPGKIDAFARLGRDIVKSWLTAQLHVSGISKVELQFSDCNLEPDEYAVSGKIALTDGGTRW